MLRVPALALALSLACAPLLAQQAAVAPRPWEHESSDIPLAPRVRIGALDNGLRWAWMDNTEPRQRSFLRLHVDIGSLAETDDEQGLAHFLEHMAFNGSANFPPGSLVEWFQRHGMAFGADTNAMTSFSETIYQLDLPTSDEATLREGLQVLRDMADGLLLLEEEVAREVGVIDGEERERDSARLRAALADLRHAFAGSRVVERIPIGKAEVRARFDAQGVRAFYERWYRPDLMTLVLVGDLAGLDPAPLFAEYFAGLRPPPEGAPREPAPGRIEPAESVFSYASDELPVVTISAGRLRPWVDEPHDRATTLRDLPLAFARRMLNLRFSELAKAEGAPFLAASVSSAGGFRVLDGEQLTVVAKPESWRAALALGEQELRRALQHGFDEGELDEVRRDVLRELDEAVEREATRSSASWTAELLQAVEDRHVPTSAAAERELMAPAVAGLDVDACRAAFADAWGRGALRLSAVGGPALELDALKAAWDESAVTEVGPREARARAAFAYDSGAREPVEPVERAHVQALDVVQARFANGVAVNVKRTDFKQRQVLVAARVGQGQLSQEPAEAPRAFLADQIFDQSGLAAHSVDDLRRLTAGRQATVAFTVGPDAFELRGATTPEDLPLQLELLAAHLAHPGWREEGLRQARQQFGPLYESLDRQLTGPIQTRFLRALHGGDPRFGLPTREQLEALEMSDLREWLGPELAAGPIELTIVGDVDPDAALAAAGRTFGALPERRAALDVASRLSVALQSGLHMEAEVLTEVPGALVVIVYPTTDGRQARMRRSLVLLGQIVADRLRVQVREERGAAYSPGAGSQSSRVYPGLGSVQIQAMAASGREAELLEACLAVGDALAADGITEEELARQREPLLARLRDELRRNGFWLELLSESQSNPAFLEEATTLLSEYESIGVDELSALAKRHLAREQASWIVVRSRAPGT